MTLHLLRPELRPERRDKPDFRAHSLGGDGAVVIERVLDECISITWLSPTVTASAIVTADEAREIGRAITGAGRRAERRDAS
jgi:hypothetical protein